MLIERFFTPELAQVAYAVGDRDAGEVIIIDPRRDIDGYRRWADAEGLRIAGIIETHVHADFVSGAPALAEATGAPVYASRLGDQDFPHVPVDDGLTLEIGRARLTAVHTPGHTPEHMSWLVEDTSDPDAAPVLFSGDSLFVGDVGRPDLLGEERTGALVEQLYRTVTNVFERLPADTIVYPGHTAGSSCGKKIGDDPMTTIGREKRENYAFQPETVEAFRRAVLDDMPRPPTYYPELKKINKAGAAPLEELSEGTELDADAAAARQAAGSLIVDARNEREVARGYIPGSVFAGAGNNMSTWMGWLAPYDRDVVLIVDSRDEYEQSRLMLRRIGLDRVAGYMIGVEGWQRSGRELDTVGEATVEQLSARIGEPDAPVVLDVRSESEYEEGHIPGARHHFLGAITRGELPDLPKDADIAVVCGGGYRSMVASTLMKEAGFDNVSSVIDGMDAWDEAHRDVAV